MSPTHPFVTEEQDTPTAVVAITGNGYAEEKQVGNTMIIDGIDVTTDPEQT